MKREEQVEIAIKTLGIKGWKAILVGDTVNDAASAAKLKMMPIGINEDSYKLHQFIEFGIPCFSKITSFMKFIIKIKGGKGNEDNSNT